jgi:hypothetical protein
MPVDEGHVVGKVLKAGIWKEWCKEVSKKHPPRAEAKRIGEEGSFQRLVKEDINPDWKKFDHSVFQAQEGMVECARQVQRSKMMAIKQSSIPLPGPKRAFTNEQIETRKMQANRASIPLPRQRGYQHC